MTYERFRLGRQKLRYDNTNDDVPLQHQFEVGDGKLTPTSATIAISLNGVEKLAATGTGVTVSGSLISYILSTVDESTWQLAKGYRVDLVVTYASKTYDRHFFFDIAKYVFRPHLTRDQLLAYDQRIQGMNWAGDPDFSEIIGACRDELQARIETKMADAARLKEEMLIDSSQVAVAFRRFVLSRIFRSGGDHESANDHRDAYQDILSGALATTPIDKGETGSEGSDAGAVGEVKFEL